MKIFVPTLRIHRHCAHDGLGLPPAYRRLFLLLKSVAHAAHRFRPDSATPNPSNSRTSTCSTGDFATEVSRRCRRSVGSSATNVDATSFFHSQKVVLRNTGLWAVQEVSKNHAEPLVHRLSGS